jgi:mRNA turnover protein 4
MPKSKRARVYHLTQVTKKGREQKDKLFANIRECIPQYQHCFVFSVDNMRNNYLKDVRHELSDCRYVPRHWHRIHDLRKTTMSPGPKQLFKTDTRLFYSIFFGKTKLTARALGTTPEEAQADGLHELTKYLSGSVGLIFTNRPPQELIDYFANLTQVDFARAGAVAPRDFIVPPGQVFSTGGEVPAEHDVPVSHTLEPELRRLGMPTRMVKGKVHLECAEPGYVVCREGDVLDARQTRLLKLFSVCMSEFRVALLAYWSSGSGEVTELEAWKERKEQLRQMREQQVKQMQKAAEGRGQKDGEAMEEDDEDEESD